MKKVAIITGTSRGLGLSLANFFLENGYFVVGIARTNEILHPNFYFHKSDLSSEKFSIAKLNSFCLGKKLLSKSDHVVLVNNAATVTPIHFIDKLNEKEMTLSYQLNLHAPMVISQWALQKFLKKSRQVTICNISSGAALRPLFNWSIYCTMKAGLKMFTDCLNLEFSASGKFKAFSFYPGVMDTKMQETIRKQNSKSFKNVEKFKELKEKNQLLDPKAVALCLFKIINSPSEINKTEYNVMDLLK